jgi:CheY-like chemotaxis protein
MTRVPGSGSNNRQNQTQAGQCVIGEADPFLAQLLQRFVEKSGLRARLAQSGDAVLACVFEEETALIILEPELPGKIRGWEAARRIADGDTTGTIPIILCSWLDEPKAQALVGQELNHLQKPELHYTDFLQAVWAVGLNINPDDQ